jgi:hypothetical protein
LGVIQNAYTDKTIIVGDFKLDLGSKSEREYAFRNYFNDMEPLLASTTLEQIVSFLAWSRAVNWVTRESTLDHIYCSDLSAVLGF